ncbi:hypothetical protein P691DRAFT_799776 [Macrolepiota fuliginosa MF-IS2]|uniref:Uncharacterized protein n=1 Tax=Macrolepiota fuliginosa MF-IS2 TaxID=1400762 RepID=A0A9P6BXA5_9AGAR|nr:hypothetical protein P691DRAFT_799776 [Macrolepiota fuliginosa MF-IS2]
MSNCKTGGFYPAPTTNRPCAVSSLLRSNETPLASMPKRPTALTATCSYVTAWQNVDFTSVTVDLMSPGHYTLGAGPVFTATYTNPTSGNPPPAADALIKTGAVTNTDQGFGSGPTSHILWRHGGNKTQRFGVAVDKRMSTISAGWGSVTGAGANAAIRNSTAVSGNRASSFSFGGIRPASGLALDDGAGNQAGIGARQMSQMRTGVGLRNPPSIGGERMSRVSFADGVRQPSGESRRTRAFHHDYVPPVPSIPAGVAASSPSDEDGALSPRQTHGPLALTPEDIRTRIAAGSRARSTSNASTPSAATTQQKDGMDDITCFLPAHTHPAPPPSIPSPLPTMMSPVMATMPLPMSASVMSPDEMLRAYAERRSTRTMTPVNGSLTMSMPIPMPMSPPPTMAMVNTGNSVRPLFGPTGVMSPTNTGNGHGRRGSVAVGQYGGTRYEIGEDEDAYGGTA